MKKFFKNWSFLFISDIIQQVTGFIAVIILARKLSPSGYGEFNVLISLTGIFTFLSNIGMSHVIIREIATNLNISHFLFKRVLPLRLISFLLSIFLLVIYAFREVTFTNSHVFFSIFLILGATLWDLFESIAFGNRITKFSSLITISYSIIWLIIIAIIPKDLLKVNFIFFIYSFLNLAKAIVYYSILKYKTQILNSKGQNIFYSISRNKIILMSLPYLWLIGIVTILNQIPILILNSKQGSIEVGYFSVGYKFIIPVVISVTTLFKALFPFMSEIFKDNPDQFNKYMEKGFKAVLLLGTSGAFILAFMSEFFIPFFFGSNYIDSIPVFNILVWFAVIASVDNLLVMGLSSAYKQNLLALISTLDLIIALPLYIYGANFGSIGLATSKLIVGVLTIIFHWVVLIKVFRLKIAMKDFIQLLFFFFIALSLSLINISLIYKAVLIVVLLIPFFLFNESPVRLSLLELIKLVKNKSKI